MFFEEIFVLTGKYHENFVNPLAAWKCLLLYRNPWPFLREGSLTTGGRIDKSVGGGSLNFTTRLSHRSPYQHPRNSE